MVSAVIAALVAGCGPHARPGGGAGGAGAAETAHCTSAAQCSFDPARTLLITDLGVVEDPSRTFNPCTQAGTAMGPGRPAT